jgi:hypothetical protein
MKPCRYTKKRFYFKLFLIFLNDLFQFSKMYRAENTKVHEKISGKFCENFGLNMVETGDGNFSASRRHRMVKYQNSCN